MAFVSQARGVTYIQRVRHAADACRELGFDTVCLPPVTLDDALPVAELERAVGDRRIEAVVLHRVVSSPSLTALLDRCRQWGAAAIYDADDLVFGPDYPLLFDELGRGRHPDLLDQAIRARQAVQQIDRAWAATPVLAEAMYDIGVADVTVVPNSYSSLQQFVASRARRAPFDSPHLVIGYGSGSGTHACDLGLVAEPLAAVLDRLPQARFHFVGRERLPAPLAQRSDRVLQTDPVRYADLSAVIARWNISLAPVVPRPFNEAKSELKFIDASLVAVPTVASPTEVMRQAIVPGQTGLLAASATQWHEAVLELSRDRVRRTLLGARARRDVHERYGPDARRAAVAASLARQPLSVSA
ncbi:MAG: glycosyltransferase [Acidimicrobiales bacterium]